ncbi:hypothetical protein L596_023347 [Steinernema carpocapsae]|uniref:Uncharacterized protein n=1 Tax=Steinernema carpocapsae TaxID=34508 RepID=A0A4U5MDF1_STECR|nr:hypothetical protein L596_023347 [Steinernema carpocapsae]
MSHGPTCVPLWDDRLYNQDKLKSCTDLSPLPIFVGTRQDFFETRQKKVKFTASIASVTLFCCSLPLFAIVLCVVSSLYYDFGTSPDDVSASSKLFLGANHWASSLG